MMAFPGMLVDAAKKAGMEVPPDPDFGFDPLKYPHFQVFCNVQLERRINWGEHWENAEIIAKVPLDKIRDITLQELLTMGLRWQQ